MKFTKVALAVAVATLAAAAQAQTANVTVYGSLRANLEMAKYSQNGVSKRITSMENVSSRWGLRGSESLGGGMSAIFQLESGFDLDTGNGGSTTFNGTANTARLFSREAWVGLQGNFGTVKLGYGLTPFDDVLGMAHHQGANSWENRNNGVGGGAGFGKQALFSSISSVSQCNTPAFDARYPNSISYATPNMGGVVLRTQYAFISESVSPACKAWDTAITYRQGPLALGATYALHSNFTSMSNPVPHKDKSARLYASFDAGVARIDGSYEASNYGAAVGRLKYKYWDIGAVAPVGAATAGVQYSSRDKGLASYYTVGAAGGGYAAAAPTVASWDKGGGKHLALTLDYPLSKRTQIRSYYSQMKNETGVKITALSTGLWHNF